MRRAVLRAAVVAAATFISPGLAEAGIIDWIWEMSGPQMIGAQVITCDFDMASARDPGKESTPYQCELLFRRVAGDRDFRLHPRKWVLSVGGALYGALDHESDMGKFKKGSVWMFGVEPTVEYRFRKGGFGLIPIAGGSFFVLKGSDFEPFGNAGGKLALVVKTGPIGLEYTMRIFPSRFTARQFGRTNPNEQATREYVHGLALTLWRY
jgi:hypothetical protein